MQQIMPLLMSAHEKALVASDKALHLHHQATVIIQCSLTMRNSLLKMPKLVKSGAKIRIGQSTMFAYILARVHDGYIA